MAETQQLTSQLLSAGQIGQKLGLSKRTVIRLNTTGKIPEPLRIGGSVRWRVSDIDQWLSMGCPDKSEFERKREGAGL